MAFNQAEAEQLLARTGRRCCICKRLHGVQLHHIIPREEGGSDDIDNAIPLCPNCHDEVHAAYASGRVTRRYTTSELKQHRQITIQQAQSAAHWQPGSQAAQQDQELILFYAQCLDRPAFRTRFTNEDSFSDFDRAMEDTLTAINTGYARLKDGTTIERAKGKVHLVRADWREKMDQIATIIQEIRSQFQHVLGLDEMLVRYYQHRQHAFSSLRVHTSQLAAPSLPCGSIPRSLLRWLFIGIRSRQWAITSALTWGLTTT